MNEEESSPVKLDEPSLKKAAQVWPQLKVLQKPLTSMYHTLPSQASNTRSNMTLVEYQPSLQLCFLRTYPKPGPMIVEKARAQAAADTDLLTGLDHPHVIKCLEVLEDKKNFYVVTEALVGNEVLDFLSNRVSVTESLACRVLGQVLLGLAYTHAQGVPHLCLHPNLLLFKSAPKDEVLHLKIAGFEESRGFRTKGRGVVPYTAPEIYGGRAEVKSDVWSCGMLLYRMLAGETAISSTEYASVLTKSTTWCPGFREASWVTRSPEVKALVSSMLAWNWSARPKVTDCLQHVWMENNRPPLLLTSKGARSCLARLTAFNSKRPLRDALKVALLSRVSSEMPLLICVFTALDKDCDGLLGSADLSEGLKGIIPLDQVETEVTRLLSCMDKSNSRRGISYNDFLIATSSDKLLLSQESLLKTFTSLDREKRRKLSLESLVHLFERSAEEERGKLWGELARQARRETGEELDFQDFTKVLARAVTGTV